MALTIAMLVLALILCVLVISLVRLAIVMDKYDQWQQMNEADAPEEQDDGSTFCKPGSWVQPELERFQAEQFALNREAWRAVQEMVSTARDLTYSEQNRR